MKHRNTPKHGETCRNVPASSRAGTGGTNGTPPKGGVFRVVPSCVPGRPAKHSKHAEAEKLADLLARSEAALIDAVARTDFLSIREAGKLVGMIYRLRLMRHEVELKAGIW